MELEQLLTDLQGRYLSAYEATYHENVSQFDQFTPEVVLEISGGVYRKLYVADFVGRTGADFKVVEVDPGFGCGRIRIEYNDVTIEFDSVSWDAMDIRSDPEISDLVGFDEWFSRWLEFDRTPRTGEIASGMIHSVVIDGVARSIDFGTAPPAAAIELFELYRSSGAKRIVVTDSRQ